MTPYIWKNKKYTVITKLRGEILFFHNIRHLCQVLLLNSLPLGFKQGSNLTPPDKDWDQNTLVRMGLNLVKRKVATWRRNCSKLLKTVKISNGRKSNPKRNKRYNIS